MERELRGKCVVVLINCTAGMHRSVAMAERLAERVGMREGFKAECLHLDLAKGADVQDRIRATRVTERSETSPTRVSTILRREVRTTSEAQGGRRAGPDAEAASRIRESLRGKPLVFGTSTFARDPRPQQRETFGRSAGPSERDRNQRSRLSP